MMPYPLHFRPILKEKVWGGRALEKLGKDIPPGARIGESWELADLPADGSERQSVIANGRLAGLTLREAIQRHRELIMGAAELNDEEDGGAGFPLLIKYLDARENLSVQVHPDEHYARSHPEAHLKSEAWVVIDAEPGAVIYKGLKHGVTRDCVRRHAVEAGGGRLLDDLVAVRAVPGACHYLPSGTVHALGAGVVVAEVQTPSDTTFRLWDWDREASDGGTTQRKLHVEQAIECMRIGPVEEQIPYPPVEADGVRTTLLVETPHFNIERMEAVRDGASSITIVTSEMPEIWMVLHGRGEIHAGGERVELTIGRTVLMPAAMPETVVPVERGTVILRVSLPSPLLGLIAEAA
jgi:mannose-6-phosphate isomerase